tara:strand:- start:213 stop:632 length:420 start_codon:yes stop_codon:yes gene_type:complete
MIDKKIGSIDSYPFKHFFSTRWIDQDAFRHINNAVFLSYFEDARINFFKRWNIDYGSKSLVIASVKVDYLRQVEHPSDLLIGQKISRIGTKSFDVEAVIFNKDKPCCISMVTIVCYDFINKKSIRIFNDIIDDFNRFNE